MSVLLFGNPILTNGDEMEEKWLCGFTEAIFGETIVYESPHSDVKDALIARATDGKSAIEWRVELPETAESQLNLVWLAGMGTNLGENEFTMSINGKEEFRFSTKNEMIWKLEQSNGLALSFDGIEFDKHGDLFGYNILSIDRDKYQSGNELTITITGENAGSNVWYMAFDYQLNSSVKIIPEQAVIKTHKGNKQSVMIELVHLGDSGERKVAIDNDPEETIPVKLGLNKCNILLNPTEVARERKIEISDEEQSLYSGSFTQYPVEKRNLHILHHSHTDIGYTELQTTVEKMHWKYIDEAIELAEKFRNYPEGARFKWNIEVLWPLQSYLERADEAKKKKFVEAVNKGFIGLNAAYSNQLTGLARDEEMINTFAFARELKETYGLDINSSMITDIPGTSWGMVTAMSLNGIKYYSSGPNYQPNLPHWGDRIGYTLRQWGDKPFYWISSSGEEKVLFWVAGKGYSMFHGGDKGRITQVGEKRILDYMRELFDKKYPYELVQMRYTIKGDNGPPDEFLSDFVKTWNEKYITPKITISTTEELFSEFEERYGKELPEYAGDFTPYWEDGALSTARENAMSRNSAEVLSEITALWMISGKENFPSAKAKEAWKNVLLFTEHTWGAYNSVSEPDADFVKGQWEIKQNMAEKGAELSRQIADEFSNIPREKEIEELDVLNSNSWNRSGVVYIPKEYKLKGNCAKDVSGNLYPTQKLSDGSLAVLIDNVQAMGKKRIIFSDSEIGQKGDCKAEGNKISNGKISLEIDKETGSVSSMIWNGKELVNSAEGRKLNEYLYVAGADPKDAKGTENVKISVKEEGPVVVSLLIESDAAGCNKLIREIRLTSDSEIVEIINRVDKKGIREKEGVHFAFPMNVPDGVVSWDVPFGKVEPDKDQLEGSCKNHISIQRMADVTNSEYGVSFYSPDAPLIELGNITAEVWNLSQDRPWMKDIPQTETIYSYVMNNYWHTNYKADQEGEVLFRYYLRPHLADEPGGKRDKSGIELTQPLILANHSENKGEFGIDLTGYSSFVTALYPIEKGNGVVAVIHNPSTKKELLPLKGKREIYLSDLFGEKKEVISEIEIPSYGTRVILIEK